MTKTVRINDHYSPTESFTFFRHSDYLVRDEMLKSFNLFTDENEKEWFNVPKSFIVGGVPTPAEKETHDYGDDAWSMVVDRVGIKRHTVKAFFFKYWHEVPIPQICKEERLRAQDVAHMIAVFNEWADARDPEEHMED